MKLFRTVAVVGLLVLCSAFGASAQDSSLAETSDPVRLRQMDSLLIVLQAQNELMRRYDERLLATVYWSLGGLGVIAGLLLGFGWYANFRVYERDKAALRQELRGLIQEDVSNARHQLLSLAEEFQNSFTDRQAGFEKRTVSIAKSAAEEVQHSVEEDLASIRYAVRDLTYELTEMQADSWRTRGVITNELRAILNLVRLAKAQNADWRVSRALDRMRNAFRDGVKPDADLAKDVVATLDALPEQYAAEVDNLKTALRASRA